MIRARIRMHGDRLVVLLAHPTVPALATRPEPRSRGAGLSAGLALDAAILELTRQVVLLLLTSLPDSFGGLFG